MTSSSRTRRIAATTIVLLATVLLSSCRVDTNIGLSVKPNGSGDVTVEVVADADVVTQAPGLDTDLRLDDVRNSGWKTDGPEKLEDGGMRLLLTHPFDNPVEATAILNQLNGPKGPLKAIVLARTGKDNDSTWDFTGQLAINGGTEAFIDDTTLELIGAAPYAGDIRRSGQELGQAVGVTLRVSLPGDIVTTTALQEEGKLVWRIPMDGSTTEIATQTKAVDVASTVSRFFKPVLLVLLVVWVVGVVFLYTVVSGAQRRRSATGRF